MLKLFIFYCSYFSLLHVFKIFLPQKCMTFLSDERNNSKRCIFFYLRPKKKKNGRRENKQVKTREKMLLAQESIFFRWRMKELTRKIHSFFITFFIYVGSHGISCSSLRFRPSKKLETRSLCKFVDFLSFDLFHMSFYLKIRKRIFFAFDTRYKMMYVLFF